MAKAKRVKTWVEKHKFTHVEEGASLITHLNFAVYQTCQRLRWDMTVERQTDTFAKIQTWLPSPDGTIALSFVDVFFDTETPGRLFTGTVPPSGDAAAEGKAFWESLQAEVIRTLAKWGEKKDKDERGRLLYLASGKEHPIPEEINKSQAEHMRYLLTGKREASNKPTGKRGKSKQLEDNMRQRKAEIERLKGLGRTNEEVAEALKISAKTVQRYLKRES